MIVSNRFTEIGGTVLTLNTRLIGFDAGEVGYGGFTR